MENEKNEQEIAEERVKESPLLKFTSGKVTLNFINEAQRKFFLEESA